MMAWCVCLYIVMFHVNWYDDYVPMEHILHLRRINEDAKLVIIPGASHRFLEEGAWDMVLDLTRDWFEFQQVLVTDWE